jgi:hypothetical protein
LRLSCLEAPTPPDRGDISGQSTRFSTTSKALRAVKETKKHDELHVDLTRQCDKSPVTTSAVLHCVYLAWKHPSRRIEVTFQVSRPVFPPRRRPCERSKRLRSTMNCTLTSPDSVISPQSQRAQFSIAFILPGNTHAAGSRWHFRSVDPLFHHEHGLACGQRD